MKINTTFYIFLSLLLFANNFSLLFGQEKNKLIPKIKSFLASDNKNSIQSTGDDIKFKDDSNNELLNIIDEGNFGSIKFSSGVPAITTSKLYNNNGSLYFGGSKILTNLTLARLSDLSDVQGDNVSYLLLGPGSGLSNTGFYNTSLGINSLHSNTSGTNNTALGYLAMYANVDGDSNVAIGTNAMQFGKGSNNTAIGKNALQNVNAGSFSTAIGSHALEKFNSAYSYDYVSNVAIGAYALSNITLGYGNTAVGTYALSQNQGGDATAIGFYSQKNATGWRNTSLGAYSLYNATTSQDNTAIGYHALYEGAGGQDNVAIGSFSLENNVGYGNTACGTGSLNNNTGGYNNSVFGYGAGGSNTTGIHNTLIGAYVDSYNEGGSNNVIIGYEAGMGPVPINHNKSGNVFIGYQAGKNDTTSNKLYIENSSSSSPLIWGDFANDIAAVNGKFGVGTQAPSDKVEIDAATGEDALRVKVGTATKLRVYANGGTSIGANYSGTPTNGLYVAGDIQNPSGVLHSSDIRFKKNISTITKCIESIKTLNGVYYDWKIEEFPNRNFNNKRQIGVIAQEVEKVFPELVNTDSEGYKSVNYSKLTPILIEAIKEQENKIEQIKKQNEELTSEISQIKSVLKQIVDFKKDPKLTSK